MAKGPSEPEHWHDIEKDGGATATPVELHVSAYSWTDLDGNRHEGAPHVDTSDVDSVIVHVSDDYGHVSVFTMYGGADFDTFMDQIDEYVTGDDADYPLK